MEEIWEELNAAFTCVSLGLEHDLQEDSTAHIGSWLRARAQEQDRSPPFGMPPLCFSAP